MTFPKSYPFSENFSPQLRGRRIASFNPNLMVDTSFEPPWIVIFKFRKKNWYGKRLLLYCSKRCSWKIIEDPKIQKNSIILKYHKIHGKQTNYKFFVTKFKKYRKNEKKVGYKHQNRIKTHDSMIKRSYAVKNYFLSYISNSAWFLWFWLEKVFHK